MTLPTRSIEALKSTISFSVQKLGFITVQGTIADFSGTIAFSKEDLTNSFFDVCVRASTLSTGNPKRDEHLKSPDFFAIQNHPKVCFKSSSVKEQQGEYIAIGALTILGNTHNVEIPLKFNGSAFEGAFSLNRKDYGLGKKFPAFFIGNSVSLQITCTLKNV